MRTMSPKAKEGAADSRPLSRQRTCALVFTILALGVAGCTDVEELGARFRDLDNQFASISVGMHGADRETVMAAMGKPRDNYVTNVGGLQVEVVEFRDHRLQYSVVLLGGHAWAKKASPIPSTTRKE